MNSAERTVMTMRGIILLCLFVMVAGAVSVAYRDEHRKPGGDDAVVLTKAGVGTAQWNYQQLPMRECRWCGRTVNLNRHHAVPQAANPALRDVRENLIVLCRDCHFVLGHRCDWKRYNPDVMYIATHFTNCVKSADTRREVERVAAPVTNRPPIVGYNDITDVTNDVPPEQRSALERMLRWNPESPSRSTP